MKKLLLIAAIVLIVACVIFLLLAAMQLHAYYNVYDGSAELYSRLHQRAITHSVIGIVLAAASAACFILRAKL